MEDKEPRNISFNMRVTKSEKKMIKDSAKKNNFHSLTEFVIHCVWKFVHKE